MDKKILVVDDDLITLKLLDKVLKNAGYQTTIAKNGYEGLQEIHNDPPHMLVLDLTLPDIDGVTVYNEIRKYPNLSDLYIIVLSSRDDPNEIASLLNKGVNDYIVKKPGAEKELLGKCASVFSRWEEKEILRGHVISFFSAKGGNGTSTLCLNLAHALAKQVDPKEIVVGDLVLPLGSISIMVGIDPVCTVADLSMNGQIYDSDSIKSCLPFADSWGFPILAGAGSPSEAHNVDPEGIALLFKLLREAYDYVIFDLGRTLSKISIPIVQQSSIIVFVLGPDLVTVDLSKSALDYITELGVDSGQIFPILNRAVGLEGLTKQEIEQKLGISIKGTISYKGNNFTLATNQNLPYASRYPNDGITFDMNDLIKRLLLLIEPVA
ncbi:MAG: response regulator [Anaerolineales bacterium]|nr:response regulator [Chloroflexota bacterium]MBL6981047.1 response regulator [Anaerolineales bacterium]